MRVVSKSLVFFIIVFWNISFRVGIGISLLCGPEPIVGPLTKVPARELCLADEKFETLLKDDLSSGYSIMWRPVLGWIVFLRVVDLA